ncbi:MAG TPA: hypothetical protein VFR37_20510 [Longimicrobium sp.]|nr:hypothetical protein [Longimicrobium sp.]
MNVLDALRSRDSRRIWAASWEVVLSRDEALLVELAVRVAEIRAATRGVRLLGIMGNAPLAFALRKLDFYVADHPCPCALYLSIDFYDPDREASAGNVSSHEEVDADGRPTGTFRCACTLCGARYDVVRSEYHYPWWRWTPA